MRVRVSLYGRLFEGEGDCWRAEPTAVDDCSVVTVCARSLDF